MDTNTIKDGLESIKEKLSNYRSTVDEVKERYQTIDTVDRVKTNLDLNHVAETCVLDHTRLSAIKLDLAELRLDIKQLYRYLSSHVTQNEIRSTVLEKDIKRELDNLSSFLDEYNPALANLISSLAYRLKFYNAFYYMSKC